MDITASEQSITTQQIKREGGVQDGRRFIHHSIWHRNNPDANPNCDYGR
jgi:hypothetical protein